MSALHQAQKPRYAMAFFDVQNFFRHAREAFENPLDRQYHHPNFDPKRVHQKVCEALSCTPTLTRFYTGVPSTADDELWGGYWNSRVLALKRAGIDVTTRPLRYHTESDSNGTVKRIPHEKGIDVRIALDLVKCVRKKQLDVAIIFSRDSDLQEAVEEAKEVAQEQSHQLEIVSAFPCGGNSPNARGIDKTNWFKVDKAFYDACIDPRDYRPAKFRPAP